MARTDPYRNFRFKVTIGDAAGGFQRVTGIKKNVEVVEYREGNEATNWTRKMPGQASFDNITLERGYLPSDTMGWDLMDKVSEEDGIDAQGDWSGGTSAGHAFDVTIEALDKKQATVRTWTLENAWPVSYSVADFDATANEVLVNSLELAYENLKDSGSAAA